MATKIADLDTRYGQSVPIQYPRTNTITTVDSTGTVGEYTSITTGADGLPVIAYYDATSGDLKVAKCGNTACSSGNTITTVDSTGDVGKWTSITIGTDGLPIISYYDTASNGELKVAKCGNASCSSGNTITTVTTGGPAIEEGQSSSITIGTDGLPVISYLDTTNTAIKVAKCGNATCSSGNTISIIESLAGTVNQTTSIIIGTDGLPLISYHHKNGTVYAPRVAKCGNSACSSGNIISNLDATTNIIWHTSISVGPDGLPVVSYYDGTNYDLKVAKCGNSSCSSSSLITADSVGDVGYFTSVTTGVDGLPIISYYDLTNGDLKVVKCGTSCNTTGNAVTNLDVSADTVGWYTSITIGTDGLPVISYWDGTNGDLKVAKCANQYCINNWSRR